MPVTMPPFPMALYQIGKINVTVHDLGESAYFLVFSRFDEHNFAQCLGVASAHWSTKASNPVKKRFANSGHTQIINPENFPELGQFISVFTAETGTSPHDLISQFTVPAGRALFTGHIMGVRKFGDQLERPDSVIAGTAHRFQELLNWGETSAAYVIANLEETPLQTIHSRLRLAKQRGLFQGPGTTIRRQKA